MLTRLVVMVAGIILVLGCAKVQVQAPKDPIKVDISMRLDIYQHVENDINAIENIVSGSKAQPVSSDKQSFLGRLMPYAYAQEGLGADVEQAALRRRDRLAALSSQESKGVVGENDAGQVEIRKSQAADSSVRELVSAENADRLIIYKSIAKKNGTSLEDVQKLYAKKLQGSAPSGTPIEVASSNWQIK